MTDKSHPMPRPSASARRGRSPDSAIRRSIDRRGLKNFAATALACMLVAASMLLHAWVRTRVTEQGYRLSRLSAEHRDLAREHEALQIKAASWAARSASRSWRARASRWDRPRSTRSWSSSAARCAAR
jgi:hypothetical protein